MAKGSSIDFDDVVAIKERLGITRDIDSLMDVMEYQERTGGVVDDYSIKSWEDMSELQRLASVVVADKTLDSLKTYSGIEDGLNGLKERLTRNAAAGEWSIGYALTQGYITPNPIAYDMHGDNSSLTFAHDLAMDYDDMPFIEFANNNVSFRREDVEHPAFVWNDEYFKGRLQNRYDDLHMVNVNGHGNAIISDLRREHRTRHFNEMVNLAINLPEAEAVKVAMEDRRFCEIIADNNVNLSDATKTVLHLANNESDDNVYRELLNAHLNPPEIEAVALPEFNFDFSPVEAAPATDFAATFRGWASSLASKQEQSITQENEQSV